MKFSGVGNQAGRSVNPVYVCSGSERGGDACCRATAVLLEDESNEQPGRLSMRKLKIFSGLPHASRIYLSPRIIKAAVYSALWLDFLRNPLVGRGLGPQRSCFLYITLPLLFIPFFPSLPLWLSANNWSQSVEKLC